MRGLEVVTNSGGGFEQSKKQVEQRLAGPVVCRPLLAVVVVLSGCDFGGGGPPPEGILSIENVAKWYSLYRAKHQRKFPPDEQAFVKFVSDTLSSRGQPTDIDQLLISPRDGKKYEIQYGEPTSRNPEHNVAVRESEGYGGKKLIAFESAWSQEVDDAELQSLMTRQ